MHRDKYSSHEQLLKFQKEGVDWDIRVQTRKGSCVLVIAPHGGRIEPRTGEIARAIAGNEISYYLFQGWKKRGENQVLHITSHRFNEQRGIKTVRSHDIVVAIHGCEHPRERAFIGGLDDSLIQELVSRLDEAGITVETEHPDFKGTHPNNICNRGKSSAGVQFELSLAFRKGKQIKAFIKAVRSVLLARQKDLVSSNKLATSDAPERE